MEDKLISLAIVDAIFEALNLTMRELGMDENQRNVFAEKFTDYFQIAANMLIENLHSARTKDDFAELNSPGSLLLSVS